MINWLPFTPVNSCCVAKDLTKHRIRRTECRLVRNVGFLLAKDSLIKSSHASHPIAGQRPGAADGKRPGQRPGVTARVA